MKGLVVKNYKRKSFLPDALCYSANDKPHYSQPSLARYSQPFHKNKFSLRRFHVFLFFFVPIYALDRQCKTALVLFLAEEAPITLVAFCRGGCQACLIAEFLRYRGAETTIVLQRGFHKSWPGIILVIRAVSEEPYMLYSISIYIFLLRSRGISKPVS